MGTNGTIEIRLKGNRRFRVKQEGDKWRVAVREKRSDKQRGIAWYEATASDLTNAIAYLFDRIAPNKTDREIADYVKTRFTF